MISAIIVDDEPINISNLQALLARHCKEMNVVATAGNADEARVQILEYKPDVVFLDIEMPGKNAFELLKSLEDITFEVIFVSAYNTYGIMAVKFSALDYLLKPINVSELKIAVEKIEQAIHDKRKTDRLNNLLALLDNKIPDGSQKIGLPTQKETWLVPVREILRCESSNNYTTFYLINGTSLLISRPIYEYEELLGPYGFIRCHQSHLVNKMHVTRMLNEDSGYLVMDFTTQKIPIAKQRKNAVRSLLKI